MSNDLYLVNKKILPPFIDLIIQVKDEMETSGETVSALCLKYGISRSTFYKYKDMVFKKTDSSQSKAIISFKAYNSSGILSSVLNYIASMNANILTINQNMPINHYAFVSITIDTSKLTISLSELIDYIKNLKHIKKVELIASGE